MAEQLESDIIRVLTQTRDEIRANMEAKRINASGRTSASIRVETYDGGVRLVGGYDTTHKVADYPPIKGTADAPDTAPIPTLEVGRPGGGNPPAPRGFYYILRQWSRDKGINFSSERDRDTFAYFLSRKIAREGTQRNKVPADVYSTPVENAKARLAEIFAANIARTMRAAMGGARVTSLRGAFSS